MIDGTYQFPTSFVGGPTPFGQGAEMQVRKFEVHRIFPRTLDCQSLSEPLIVSIDLSEIAFT